MLSSRTAPSRSVKDCRPSYQAGVDRVDHHIYPDEEGVFPDGWVTEVLTRTARGQYVAIHFHSIQLSERDMLDLCNDDCCVFVPLDVASPDE